MKPDPQLRLATAGERAAIGQLLLSAGLPQQDLATSGVVLLVAIRDEELLGCVGIEPRGEAGLIRSLAVTESERGLGLGGLLAERAEALAAAHGLRALYLLTNTAEMFWARRGYRPVTRVSVPESIQASAEFSSLCPSTAVCLSKTLDADAAAGEAPASQTGDQPEALSPRTRAQASFDQGYYCAESVLRALAPQVAAGGTRMATAFCSGMARTRGSCGAVTGAMLGLGLALGRDAPEASVQRCYEATQNFLQVFEQRFGSSNCQVLLDGCDLATPEGQVMFKEQGLRARCREFTGAAAELAQREIDTARAAGEARAG